MEVDVQELFKTLRHDATLTAMMLVMLEVAGGEPVEIADSGVWQAHVDHYRSELRKAIAIGKEEVTNL